MTNKPNECRLQEIENDAEEIAEEQPPTDAQRLKDRYMNIGAVERTRIRLHQANGSEGEGYINANYVDVSARREMKAAVEHLVAPAPILWPLAAAFISVMKSRRAREWS